MNMLPSDKKTLDLVSHMTLSELEIALYCYCGPNQTILCAKKFGFILSRKIVEKELMNRCIEDTLLTDN